MKAKSPGQAPVLAIDLGGTKILSAVVDGPGHILSRDRVPTPAREGPEAGIKAMVESARRALAGAGLALSGIGAVSVAAAGPSDPESGILFSSPNLPAWRDVPLKALLEEHLGVRAFIGNDANLAALGELCFGAGRGARHLVYVTVSTGIGGGIIIDGKLYAGASGTAGEIGHMTIDVNGPRCNCGNTGCWETLASGGALARQAKERIRAGAGTAILRQAGGDLEQVTAEAVHEAAKEGDALAEELISRTAFYFGVGLVNLTNIFNPELIIVGGGLANLGERLLGPALALVRERAFAPSYRALRMAPAELGTDSGVLGAAALARGRIEPQERG